MNNQTNPLYFILVCLLAEAIATIYVPEGHQELPIQNWGYTIGMGLIALGAAMQLRGRWKKEENGKGPWIGILGTIINIGSVISWFFW